MRTHSHAPTTNWKEHIHLNIQLHVSTTPSLILLQPSTDKEDKLMGQEEEQGSQIQKLKIIPIEPDYKNLSMTPLQITNKHFYAPQLKLNMQPPYDFTQKHLLKKRFYRLRHISCQREILEHINLNTHTHTHTRGSFK